MKEKIIQTLFSKRKKSLPPGNFELKLVKGRLMPFSAVRSHQVKSLSGANGDFLSLPVTIFSDILEEYGVCRDRAQMIFYEMKDASKEYWRGKGDYHKLSDMSAGEKPWDCQHIAGYPSYVVLVWYVPRIRKTAYYIPIGRFIELMTTSTRKSMTEEEAKLICEETITL